MYFVGPFGVAFRLHFVPAVSQADGDKIMRKYRELLAPQVRELTEQTFTENYEKAMVAAKRAQDGAEQRLHDLEEQRRQRKIRCYELMPIEDPRDYLADLLRQEVSAQQSLMSLRASEEPVKQQIHAATEKLQQTSVQPGHDANCESSLKSLVELRTQQADVVRLKYQQRADRVTQIDVDEAAAKLLEAKLELLDFRDRKQGQSERGLLKSLEREQAEAQIERTKIEATIRFLHNTRDEIQRKAAQRTEIELEIAHLDDAIVPEKNILRLAQQRISSLKDLYAEFRPIDLMQP